MEFPMASHGRTLFSGRIW
jgi:hypothetical protein